MKNHFSRLVWMFLLVFSLMQPYATAGAANAAITGEREIMLQLENKAAVVNGKAHWMEVAPILMNETTMVPLRFIAEALGAAVKWDAGESKITINMGNDITQLWIGKAQSNVNGQARELVMPATIISGNTLVPVRFVSENLNQNVSYNPDSQIITITSN